MMVQWCPTALHYPFLCRTSRLVRKGIVVENFLLSILDLLLLSLSLGTDVGSVPY